MKKVRQLIIYTDSPIRNFKHDYQVLLERGLLEFHILQIQWIRENENKCEISEYTGDFLDVLK